MYGCISCALHKSEATFVTLQALWNCIFIMTNFWQMSVVYLGKGEPSSNSHTGATWASRMGYNSLTFCKFRAVNQVAVHFSQCQLKIGCLRPAKLVASGLSAF